MKFDHIGIPTTGEFDGEIELPNLQMTVSDHQNNPFGIQWQRYWDDAPYPELVKTVPHVAFEVDDLSAALQGQRVIIELNSPSLGVTAAFAGGTANPWLKRRVLNIAHQGGEDEFPSNTLYAFRKAIRAGADMLELDVGVTSDNQVVVMHDTSVDRTTNGTGLISEKTLQE